MNTNKQKATRLQPGQYEYRHYEINKTDDHWNITTPDGDTCDATQTLSDAKDLIDQYED